MVCNSCVDKLASKLVRNHPKLDPIRARELAEKGVERVAQRKVIMVVDGIEVDPDYTQTCGSSYSCGVIGEPCVSDPDCAFVACGCPSPYSHSHLSVDTCSSLVCLSRLCTKSVCQAGSNPNCSSGGCGYDCDSGYTWNGSACVPSGGPPAGGILVQVM